MLLRYIGGRWSVGPGSESWEVALLKTCPRGAYPPFFGLGMMSVWLDHHIGYQPIEVIPGAVAGKSVRVETGWHLLRFGRCQARPARPVSTAMLGIARSFFGRSVTWSGGSSGSRLSTAGLGIGKVVFRPFGDPGRGGSGSRLSTARLEIASARSGLSVVTLIADPSCDVQWDV